ncbi:MAG: hypothetical protein JWN66_2880 [Sphingomonas bacterium]|uniref:DUF6771 family protein n=1 Tax=Sphingomonas bacterium TaxID=1895847 RepID=UPI00262B66A5|nr:DUF6771 family protein [Sphingomonas bacterium]MDB5705764.1 hypothetical protein [Sphingomonas bacterium]
MSRFAPDLAPADMVPVILNAPAWARIGIAVRDPRLRARAAETLARSILEQLDGDAPGHDANQLSLSL